MFELNDKKLPCLKATLALATSLILVVGCSSDGPTSIASDPQTVQNQEETTLQLTPRPTVFQPLFVTGQAGEIVEFSGFGFSGVSQVVFRDRTSGVEATAQFTIVSNTELEVVIPNGVTVGIVQINSGSRSVSRLFRVQPGPSPMPTATPTPTPTPTATPTPTPSANSYS
ncbi:MAG: hypothetical protein HC921_19355, partial [Synechococcaceae cyanobacterium SM2_3_1]|nr:hypothetical protein [Synechococcaceae cyanobacterium SM2_3_1]